MIKLAAPLAACLIAAGVSSASAAAERVVGPAPAEVLDVKDGDTFTALVRPWLGLEIRVAVRVFGVDAPEIKSKCGEEAAAARRAKDAAAAFLTGGAVELRNIRHDKYAGRALADVYVDGRSLAARLLADGLAVPYAGGRKQPWPGC